MASITKAALLLSLLLALACSCSPLPEHPLQRVQRMRQALADDATLRQEEVPLTFNNRTYTGWIAWSEGRGPAPLILTVHNYFGIKDFDREVAAYLARTGFVGLAVDMYGEGAYENFDGPNDHGDRLALDVMNETLRDQFLIRGLLRAWLEAGRAHPSVEEAGRAAAIGYCYGGALMQDMIRDGMDVDLVVSFHVRALRTPPNQTS